jgi:hypothetical protein
VVRSRRGGDKMIFEHGNYVEFFEVNLNSMHTLGLLWDYADKIRVQREIDIESLEPDEVISLSSGTNRTEVYIRSKSSDLVDEIKSLILNESGKYTGRMAA